MKPLARAAQSSHACSEAKTSFQLPPDRKPFRWVRPLVTVSQIWAPAAQNTFCFPLRAASRPNSDPESAAEQLHPALQSEVGATGPVTHSLPQWFPLFLRLLAEDSPMCSNNQSINWQKKVLISSFKVKQNVKRSVAFSNKSHFHFYKEKIANFQTRTRIHLIQLLTSKTHLCELQLTDTHNCCVCLCVCELCRWVSGGSGWTLQRVWD